MVVAGGYRMCGGCCCCSRTVNAATQQIFMEMKATNTMESSTISRKEAFVCIMVVMYNVYI